MRRYRSFLVLIGCLVISLLVSAASAQQPAPSGNNSLLAGTAGTDGERAGSIFNDQLRQFRFELDHEVVTIETAETFMVRYNRPENPRILGAYPDKLTNALLVVGPPEAEQAIRETLAQSIVDVFGLVGAPPLERQLRILKHERKDLLRTMADLEIQEVAAGAEENGSAKAKQLADRRQIFENQLKITEQQIHVVRKYMARLADDECAAVPGGSGVE
jgi:hypothetical protein